MSFQGERSTSKLNSWQEKRSYNLKSRLWTHKLLTQLSLSEHNPKAQRGSLSGISWFQSMLSPMPAIIPLFCRPTWRHSFLSSCPTVKSARKPSTNEKLALTDGGPRTCSLCECERLIRAIENATVHFIILNELTDLISDLNWITVVTV